MATISTHYQPKQKSRLMDMAQKMRVFLPEVASMTVETPRRSAAGRGEPGMLTGSERTGWILPTNQPHNHSQPAWKGLGEQQGQHTTSSATEPRH